MGNEWLFILISCLGLNMILKIGTIFNKPRRILYRSNFLRDLLTCSMCLGWWVGFFWQWFLFDYPDWFRIMLPFASSICCLVGDLLIFGLLDNMVSLVKNFNNHDDHSNLKRD